MRRITEGIARRFNAIGPAGRMGMGVGVAVGGAWGALTGATTEKGVISSTLGYGAIGGTIGLAAGITLPHIVKQWPQILQTSQFFWKSPTDWMGPAAQGFKDEVLSNPNLSDFNKQRILRGMGGELSDDLFMSRAQPKSMNEMAKNIQRIVNRQRNKEIGQYIADIKDMMGDDWKNWRNKNLHNAKDWLKASSGININPSNTSLGLSLAQDESAVRRLANLGLVPVRTEVPYALQIALFNTLNELAPGAWPATNVPRGANIGGLETGAINELLQQKLGTWDQIFKVINEPPEGTDQQRFAERLTGLFKSYTHSQINSPLIGPEMSVEGGKLGHFTPRGKWQPQREMDVVASLRKMGKHDLANEMVKIQKKGFAVYGFTYQDKELAELTGNKLVEIAVGAPSMADVDRFSGPGWARISVLEAGGVYKGPTGKDYYIGRRFVDPWDLSEAMMSDRAADTARRVKTISADLFAAKMISKHGLQLEGKELFDFLENVSQEVSSALTWDISEYRPDRVGNVENRLKHFIRRNQAKVFIPFSEQLARAMGYMATGEGAPFDITMKRINQSVTDYLWRGGERHGYYSAGSETAARKGVFDRIGTMLSLDWAAYENPLNKPAIVQRDPAKSFYLKGGKEAKEGMWRITQTRTMNNLMESNAPAVIRYVPITDMEHAFFQEFMEAVDEKGNIREGYQPKLVTAERFKAIWDDNNLRGFKNMIAEPFASLAEGQTATSFAPGTMMAHTKVLSVDQLNPEIFKGVDYLGKAYFGNIHDLNGNLDLDIINGILEKRSVPLQAGAGLSRGDRSALRGIYQDTTHGTTFLRKISRSSHGFVLHLEEMYPLERAKVASAIQKGFTRPVSDAVSMMMVQTLNRMRASKAFQEFYTNEPVLPLEITMPGKSQKIYYGFGRARDIKKVTSLTPQLANEMLTQYMPQMTPKGRARFIKGARALGGQIRRHGDVFKMTVPGANRMGAFTEGMQGLMMSALFSDYQSYFNDDPLASIKGIAGVRAGVIQKLQQKDLMGAMRVGAPAVFMRGLTTEVFGWDTPESNLPSRIGTTLPELQIYQQTKLKNIYKEMLGRRRILGDPDITRAFYNAESRMLTEATADLNQLIPNRFTLEQTPEFSRFDFYNNRMVGPDEMTAWRTMKRDGALKYKNNWILDLRVADAQIKTADMALRETRLKAALGGDLRVLVPGASSDLFQNSFLTEAYGDVEGSPLYKPLRGLSAAAREYYLGNDYALEKVKQHKADYLRALYTVKSDMITGRASATPDVGPNVAGRVQYRAYRKQFVGKLGNLAEHVGGVTEADFARMVKEGGQTVELGGTKFLVGTSVRYPVTKAGPMLLFADPRLSKVAAKNVIAVDEVHRYLAQMDFDGDTLYVKALMQEASVEEALGALRNSDSAYTALTQNAKFWGGLEEEATMQTEMFGPQGDSMYDMFADRAKKIRHAFGSDANSEAILAERLAKAHTAYIGEYSNISKRAAVMTGAIDYSAFAASYSPDEAARMIANGSASKSLKNAGFTIDDITRAAGSINITEADRVTGRLYLLNELQQVSINFGRQAGGDLLDPGALAKDINRMLGEVMAGNIPDANKQMTGIMDVLGFGEKQGERFTNYFGLLQTDQNQLNELVKRQVIFEEIREGFFRHTDPDRARKLSLMMRAAQKKGEHIFGPLESVQQAYDALTRGMIEGGLEGIIPAPGKSAMPSQSTGASRELLRSINNGIKAAAELAGGPMRAARHAMGTPQGQAAAGLIAGGALIAAGIGLLTPPTKLDVPEMPIEVRAKTMASLQRSPDTALVGSDGRAPVPGGQFGNVQTGMGPMALPAPETPNMPMSNRLYHQQTNRVPNVTMYHTGDRPMDRLNRAGAVAASSRKGMTTNVNMISSPQARRLSKVEIEEQAREEMTY